MTDQGLSESADSADHPARRVAAAAQRHREAVAEVKAARARRNHAICQAWQHGATVVSLTRATGLGRHSVYNVAGSLDRTLAGAAALDRTMNAVGQAVSALAESERAEGRARNDRDRAIIQAVGAGIPKAVIARSADITARNVYHLIDQAQG